MTKEQEDALREAFSNWAKSPKALVQSGTGDPRLKNEKPKSDARVVTTRTN